MDLFIAGIIVCVVIGAFILWVYKDDKRQTAENRKKDMAIQAFITDAVRNLNKDFKSELHKNYTERDLTGFDYAIKKANRVILRRLAANERLSKKFDAWSSTTTNLDRLFAAVSLVREARNGSDDNSLVRAQHDEQLEQIRGHLDDDLRACYTDLLNKAPASTQAFATVNDLIGRSREWAREFPEVIKFLAPPQNWRELVAQHLPNPSLSDYHGSVVVTDGELRLMASEVAEGTGDVAKAKIVLAFCNANNTYRDEVGETRASELADLITHHHANLST